ncbi:hypothetical protein AVEN_180081-1 [Araneus ventricosus]|uniref:Uncharacterized protein n=1 Tax=Araneus ventricosus TaxID=182803 RepID=A0A4Y2KIM5_ARAVE|nr:hypothetical protein AVEN_180081-1 [Araneus ventricosus]
MLVVEAIPISTTGHHTTISSRSFSKISPNGFRSWITFSKGKNGSYFLPIISLYDTFPRLQRSELVSFINQAFWKFVDVTNGHVLSRLSSGCEATTFSLQFRIDIGIFE